MHGLMRFFIITANFQTRLLNLRENFLALTLDTAFHNTPWPVRPLPAPGFCDVPAAFGQPLSESLYCCSSIRVKMSRLSVSHLIYGESLMDAKAPSPPSGTFSMALLPP